MALALSSTAALGFNTALGANALIRPRVAVRMATEGTSVDTELVGKVVPTMMADEAPPAPKPARKAEWNPTGLTSLPLGPLGALDLKKVCAPDSLTSSPAYLDGTLAGDAGFDPLCLAAFAKPSMESDKYRSAAERTAKMSAMSADEQAANVAWMREAELKHARLAMLAAAGWPLAELANGSWLEFAGTGGRAPSLFNGGLFELPNLPFLLLALGGTAFVEFSGAYPKKGDFGFDPLGFAAGKVPLADALPDGALPNVGKPAALELAELKNGRLAMMAITGMAVQEFVYGTPVVAQTPFFFGR